MIRKTIALAAFAAVAVAGAAEARDQIRIVGSSTVYPFATTVAENFGKTSSFKTPVIESTGSGGGLKLFCAGVGVEHPDIANASRRIKKSEVETCAKNGVKEITEVQIGFDGIVLANTKTAPAFNLTKGQIFQALAKEVPVDGKWVANPYSNWSQIDAKLPNEEIEVLGPPPTSGTRDAFVELVMETGCLELPACADLKKADEKKFSSVFASLREDGRFIEAGENDNLIVQKLQSNPTALGIFGFSFLDQNSDKIQGSHIEGVAPTFEDIASSKYKVSRPLFFYVKNAHVGTVPGIKEYVAEFTSEKAWGPEGYLSEKGLIPLPDAVRADAAKKANAFAPLTM
ncbi:PstS family phosphate ABC transporter substrate-binding protein [Rhodospirillum rubrum]|uniref:Phosphate ABC transporter, periplasmic binding protein n=1 Tax=Rhodospirillum rubrum (strain ATCC 11170 / ATH 1.1.1 / DSM 467 / LMG 4362 / NCIMB 8255 / S1) TaxID=269796 RepID=Q2RWU3_RHORT|nr:PstS family phosphate ABC transporter substrate-binding protein [Rhodospirillum rubrum]ABC21402.1 phosphate ABC transporter, periplasmic binding protein [Rhodospirillum rubrum ATCC 11170]AEO47082.1 phosphate ABC transporter periplasmic binding protein [Rhodospirillum rubrum F11]MBK5952995.1 phosphate ABC transporter substrate-binding protein [Rhodospirillum rubrum]QXG81080.1 PstS family phosphate ABC transporter substrate-binding protein [Rhodospirillum rubrum]HAP98621.1 phosphate ABC trans